VTNLASADRAKLAKLLCLLGSSHQGERDAAGLAAHKLVQKHGLTWTELLAKPTPKREPQFGTWRATCGELEKRRELRPWERKFVTDLPGFQRISTKQRYVLNEIARRVLKGGAP